MVVRATGTSAATRSPRCRSARIAVATLAAAVAAGPWCSAAGWATLPGLESALAAAIAVSASTTIVVFDRSTRLSATTAHLREESIELVLGSAADAALRTVAKAVVVTPRLSNLAVGTITSHVTSLTADTANDACSEVLLLGAVVLAVTDFTTVLAGLVLIVAEGTVERGKLTELVALEFVLALRNGSSLQMIRIR